MRLSINETERIEETIDVIRFITLRRICVFTSTPQREFQAIPPLSCSEIIICNSSYFDKYHYVDLIADETNAYAIARSQTNDIMDQLCPGQISLGHQSKRLT